MKNEVFEAQILLLEEALSEAVGRTLIGSDFKSKPPDVQTRGGGSIIDLTFAAPRLASRIGNWSVLEEITLSDHRCIEFSLEQRSQAVEKAH